MRAATGVATGVQFELKAETPSGSATAVITEVAAGIRAYSVNGIDLVETFPAMSGPPKGAGIVLVPWPNRIRDGSWTQRGVTRQLALSEPALRNASHGLLRFAPYREVGRTNSSVTLAATVFPQTGYPFQLDTEVTYTLVADGLEVTHALRNVGEADAPVALGTHPYLKIGGVPTGDLVLRLAAGTHIDVDDRKNAVGESQVDGTPFDLRAGRPVGDLDLDDGFGAVDIVAGRGEHSLTAPDGRKVILWGDENMRYVQAFTPRNFPITVGDAEPVLGQAVAIEPMTAPADAFNSGTGLRWLAPGESWTLRWGIRHAGF
ncbi:MAG: aldose 1-epimerase family protein [Cryobacterium sp.]